MAGTPKPIGRILIIPKGNYDPSTPYNSLDLVRYDYKSWLCKTDGIIGITPTEGTDWTLMTEDGTDGTDGRGIVNIQRTGTDPSNPLKDIYTITYTDGTTSTFTVTNGSGGGTTADTMLKSVYDKDDDGIVDKADDANTATNATDATNAKNLKKSDGTTISADSINTKLSKVDIDENVSAALEKKIDKPASAMDGQVLTYNGTSNEWEAQDSQGGSNGIVYLNSDVWDSTRDYVQDDYAIDEQNLYKALGNNANSKPSQNPLLWKKVSIVEELNKELIDYSNEIVVGKLNGKPLYQKIIVQDINIINGITLYEIGSETMSNIMILGATFKWKTEYFSIPRVHTTSSFNIGLEINQSNGKTQLQIITGYQYGNVHINVHVEYTKTTD